MAVELEVRDGNPWWLSPDVWVVPGGDPQGPPGSPVAGETAFLWARVKNNGSSSVQNATVRFYWANPSAGFDRTTAHMIGTSFVNLAPGESAEVLCLTPWIPVLVNDGHECILAEAFHESLDPLPASADFSVPSDRHVGQKNLSVLASSSGFFMMRAEFHNAERHDDTFVLRIHQGKVGELESMRKTLGFQLPREDGKLIRVGFSDERCPDPKRALEGATDQLKVRIPARRSIAKTIVGQFDGPAAVVHIEQHEEKPRAGRKRSSVGGLSALVLAVKEGK